MEDVLAAGPPRVRTGRRMSSFDVPAASLAEGRGRVPTTAALFRRVSLDDGAHRAGSSPHPLARRKMSVGADVSYHRVIKSKSTPSTCTNPKSTPAGSPTMVCSFGGNEYSQLGCEGVMMHTEPQPIESLENVIYISAGWTSNMALTCGGALHCWGTLMWPGSGDRSRWALPTRLDSTFRSVKQVVLSKNHALLLTGDGEVFSFGDGKWGKLGNGTTRDEPYPIKVGFDLANAKVEQIAAGEDHSVVLTQSGEVYTFGKGSNGQLGHGNRNDCSRPTKVRRLAKKKNKMRFVAAGFDQTVSISSEGQVYTFGRAGPWLGYDVRQALVTVPKRVSAVKNLKKIVGAAVGQSHTLLLAQSGEVYAMGDNRNGSLGLGEHVEQTSDPLIIEALQGHTIRQISAGAEHSLVMCEDGHVFSWGLAATGRLGCGGVLSNVYVPQQVTGIEGRPLAVSAGLQHSLVLTAPTLSIPETDVLTASHRKSVPDEPMAGESSSSTDAPPAAATDPERRSRSLDRSGGGSDSGSTSGGSGGIETLRRGVKNVVRKRLASFSTASKDLRRRGSLSSAGGPTNPSSCHVSGGSTHTRDTHQSDDDSDQVPYQYRDNGHSRDNSHPHQSSQPNRAPVDYNYYAQAEMLRARLLASPERDHHNRGGTSPTSSSMSPPMAQRLDPKVEALLRELNYHEDESITGLFVEGKVSYEALGTFTKADLAEMGLPFGPRTAIYNLLKRPAPPQVSQDASALLSSTTTTAVAQSGLRSRIGYDDLTFVCKLGTGAFGDVWKGKLRGTTTVAIKTLKANGDYRNFRVEAQIMAELPAHANVVTFYGVADADKGVYIVTEFVPDGSLDRYLMEQRDRIEQGVLVQMIKDVAAGMDHLATHGIMHRDLASRNLLVEVKRSGYHRVKVCDFGLALERAGGDAMRLRDGPAEGEPEQQQRLSNVPVRWTAIEVLLHGHYTTKSDVWSFGVTAWEIFSCGQTPYADLSTFEIVDLLLHGYKLPRPDKCPEEVYERIILRCLADDPDDRPTFHEIYRTLDSLFPTIYSSALLVHPRDDGGGGEGGLRRSAPPAQRKASLSSFVPRLNFTSTPTSPRGDVANMMLGSSGSVSTSSSLSSSSSSSSSASSSTDSLRLNETSVFSPYCSIELLREETRGGDDEADDDDCRGGREDESAVFSPYGSVELLRREEESTDSASSSCDEAEEKRKEDRRAGSIEREAKQQNDKPSEGRTENENKKKGKKKKSDKKTKKPRDKLAANKKASTAGDS